MDVCASADFVYVFRDSCTMGKDRQYEDKNCEKHLVDKLPLGANI
jgi:hypothetical protein